MGALFPVEFRYKTHGAYVSKLRSHVPVTSLPFTWQLLDNDFSALPHTNPKCNERAKRRLVSFLGPSPPRRGLGTT